MARIVHVVVNDDAVRDSIDALLSSHGIGMRGYPTADALVAALPLAAPDCLLLDIHMLGTDGIVLASQLREAAPDLPIILMSGRADDRLRRRAAAAGVRCLLDKPLDQDLLLAAIAHAV